MFYRSLLYLLAFSRNIISYQLHRPVKLIVLLQMSVDSKCSFGQRLNLPLCSLSVERVMEYANLCAKCSDLASWILVRPNGTQMIKLWVDWPLFIREKEEVCGG
jgi:hypothetical protein